jgi:hypothetical protein
MGSYTQKLYYIDGEPVWLNRDELAARRGVAVGYTEKKPGKSLSMGCHPAQVDLMNDAMKEHGIRGVEWDRQGKCVITSRRGRKRAMPVVGQMLGLEGGLHDNDGCYGD